MISYIVGASVFLLTSTFLVNFLISSPGSTTSELEFVDLKYKSASAMDVILGTAGFPHRWADDPATIDGVTRLGLIEEGTTIRLNATKFDAVARGSHATHSPDNGVVDYSEAKAALGLDGYDFHLRAFPVFDLNATSHGVTGMTSFDVGYVGDITGLVWSDAAKSEAYVLDQLPISFTNDTRSHAVAGDVHPDDATALRQFLMPLLGTRIDRTLIAAGSGTAYDFQRVNASAYSALLPGQVTPAPSKALALTATGTQLGYTPSRETRAVVMTLDMTSRGQVNLTWNEWVDTDLDTGARDDGDRGWIEASPDGGATWCTIAESRDAPLFPQAPANAFTPRVAAIHDANCPGSAFNGAVLVALHWVADGDANVGRGWIVDDLTAWNGQALPLVGTEISKRTFEDPEYELLVIGSNVDHAAFASPELRATLRDYVQLFGGRIAVLGSASPQTAWLQPIFDVALRDTTPGVASPDLTHPILTVPNALPVSAYTPATEWTFTASQASLLNKVLGTTGSTLSVSARGAFGASHTEGSLVFTSFRPYTMTGKANWDFFANLVMYGKYHHLYLEVGPQVPTSVPISATTRTATMDAALGGETSYTELAFVLYVWQGYDVAAAATPPQVAPLPPRAVSAQTQGGAIWVNFTSPAHSGSAAITEYEVRRGHSSGTVSTLVKTLPPDVFTFRDEWMNLTNGTTYFYSVVAKSAAGASAPSAAPSATPSGLPGAPTLGLPTGGLNEIHVPWSAPASSGGSQITGYRIWHGTASGSLTSYVDVGATDQWLHTGLGSDDTRYYRVQALNAAGYGANSSERSGTTFSLAGPAQEFAVRNATAGAGNLTLTWGVPVSLGTGNLTGYRIYVSTDGSSWSTLAQLNSPLNVSFQHNGLGNNVTRHYMVQAITTVGDGANTTPKSEKTFAAPDTPMSLIATPNAILQTVTLTWVAPPSEAPIVRYDVWRGPSGSETFHTSVYAPATTLVNDASGPGTWSYKVYAVSAAGTSHPATVVTTV